MALQRTGRQEDARREVTSRVGEVSGARAVGLGVYRSTNSTRPQTAARLIGLRSTRSTHERRGVCEIGRVDGVYDGNERARLWDQKSVRANSAKVIAGDALAKSS